MAQHRAASGDASARSLENDAVPSARFHEHDAASPLPRAYQWADGSAYVNHVELVRKARGAEMPASFWTDPLIYQGGSDAFLAPRDPIRMADEACGIDFEAEVAVIVDDVPMGASLDEARGRHPPGHAGQRRVAAQPDPGRARQGLRLLPVEAVLGLLAGRGDAGRTRRRLGRRQAAPAAARRPQRQAVRPGRMPAST